ncbi:hypothetical protein NQZ68_028642 [Dissostichus eleginoides]|nr:hypothetical protein NQZ68_028642 [Dissostichus eleginoides]
MDMATCGNVKSRVISSVYRGRRRVWMGRVNTGSLTNESGRHDLRHSKAAVTSEVLLCPVTSHVRREWMRRNERRRRAEINNFETLLLKKEEVERRKVIERLHSPPLSNLTQHKKMSSSHALPN